MVCPWCSHDVSPMYLESSEILWVSLGVFMRSLIVLMISLSILNIPRCTAQTLCRVRPPYMIIVRLYTILQNKRMRRCGVPPPPPIIFERLKLPQQIIYHRKGNLSESPNHQKYWENILVSRFYEQFSRSSRILGHFWKFEKISNS